MLAVGLAWGGRSEQTYDVDGVELPCLSLPEFEGHGVGLVVKCEGTVDAHVDQHHTLGTQGVRQNLNSVTDQETGPRNGVEETVQPDEEDDTVCGTLVVVLLVDTVADGPQGKTSQHTTGRGQPDRTATEAIDLQSECDGNDSTQGELAGGDTKTGSRAVNTHVLVENGTVVGDDGVARPLREETHGDNDGKTVTVTLGAEEVEVASAVIGGLLKLDGLANLAVFELNSGVVDVAVGVVLSEGLESLVVAVLGNQETWGLGDPWNQMSVNRNSIGDMLVTGTYTTEQEAGRKRGHPGGLKGNARPTRWARSRFRSKSSQQRRHRHSRGSCRRW